MEKEIRASSVDKLKDQFEIAKDRARDAKDHAKDQFNIGSKPTANKLVNPAAKHSERSAVEYRSPTIIEDDTNSALKAEGSPLKFGQFFEDKGGDVGLIVGVVSNKLVRAREDGSTPFTLRVLPVDLNPEQRLFGKKPVASEQLYEVRLVTLDEIEADDQEELAELSPISLIDVNKMLKQQDAAAKNSEGSDGTTSQVDTTAIEDLKAQIRQRRPKHQEEPIETEIEVTADTPPPPAEISSNGSDEMAKHAVSSPREQAEVLAPALVNGNGSSRAVAVEELEALWNADGFDRAEVIEPVNSGTEASEVPETPAVLTQAVEKEDSENDSEPAVEHPSNEPTEEIKNANAESRAKVLGMFSIDPAQFNKLASKVTKLRKQVSETYDASVPKDVQETISKVRTSTLETGKKYAPIAAQAAKKAIFAAASSTEEIKKYSKQRAAELDTEKRAKFLVGTATVLGAAALGYAAKRAIKK